MRALSVRQPFATLIVRGVKRFELRTWATPYRGEIAIHASSSISRRILDELLEDESFRIALEMAEIDDPRSLPERAVVGAATIHEIGSALEFDARRQLLPIDAVLCGGKVYEDDQLWRLADPWELNTPVPINGKLNLWTLPDREAARVRRGKRLPPIVTSAHWEKALRLARRA